MAKFKFGNAPKSFARQVKFETVDGVKSDFGVVFHYRSKMEYFELVDEMKALAKAQGKEIDEDISLGDLIKTTTGNNAQFILKILASWDLDDELNVESAARLDNEYPAAANALFESYRLACVEGRQGN